VEEQHLLEKLLDEIPDGEKNRWVPSFFLLGLAPCLATPMTNALTNLFVSYDKIGGRRSLWR
jgi:hypothetical protein